MKSNKNWKTTLAGILGGIILIGPQIQHCLAGGSCDWKQVALGAVLTAIGYAAKDHDVTGGTKQQ